MELQYETDHKAGLQYATKVFYRDMGICKGKPVSVGRRHRAFCPESLFMIAFLKAVSNLHQNITLEMVIEAMIKVVVANVLYLNILNIMTTVFSISSAMAKEVFTLDAPELKVEDMDIGSALFYQLFGLLFILAAIVCSFLMLWTVYSRYIKLYLLMILTSLCDVNLVGGQEIEQAFMRGCVPSF